MPPLSQKIALFVPSFRGGGAERAMILFAEGLLQAGYAVDFLVAQDEGPLRSSLPDGAKLINLRRSKVSLTLPKLVRYLRTEKPAALYSTIVNANIVALLARSIAGVRCPIIVRESNIPNPGKVTFARKLSGRLAPLVYSLADSVISVSDDVSKMLVEAAPGLKSKVTTLPNPVVSATMIQRATGSTSHPWLTDRSDLPIVLGIGRLHPQKDFVTLISAFSLLRRDRAARLIILGEGGERQQLEALVNKLGLDGDVSLPGYVENPFPFLKQASVFVLSSRYEGMPNALLQAMAFGTPVVATDCHSGAKEVIARSGFGTLVPVGDPPALARAIMSSIGIPRSESAARYVEDNFSVQRATREYLHAAGL